MKRFLLNLFTAALATAGLSLGSCSDDNDEGQKLPEPNFPAKTTLGIEVGGTCTIPISPNQAWSVSIDRTQAGEWFWLDDDGMPAYTVRGKAGDHEIVICVSDVEEHDTDRSIDITMTMGSESQVIATVTRGTVERQFDLYQGTESGFGEVTYEEEPIDAGQTTLTIPWEETSMEPERRPIKIAANFQWRLDSKPEWIAELSPSEGKAGETVEILLSGDPKAFPLEDSEDELVFCDYDNNDVKFAFRISIPGCKEKQDVTLNAGTVFSYTPPANTARAEPAASPGPSTARRSGRQAPRSKPKAGRSDTRSSCLRRKTWAVRISTASATGSRSTRTFSRATTYWSIRNTV